MSRLREFVSFIRVTGRIHPLLRSSTYSSILLTKSHEQAGSDYRALGIVSFYEVQGSLRFEYRVVRASGNSGVAGGMLGSGVDLRVVYRHPGARTWVSGNRPEIPKPRSPETRKPLRETSISPCPASAATHIAPGSTTRTGTRSVFRVFPLRKVWFNLALLLSGRKDAQVDNG